MTLTFALLIAALAHAEPRHSAGFIFPLDARHNHASAIVELPNGDLFVCWYRGSGERTADDVQVMASRRKKGSSTWSTPYVLADTPGFPDTNPMVFVDSRQRLWLFWQVIMANQWETAITRYKITTKWQQDPPLWEVSDPLLVVPRNFAAKVEEQVEAIAKDATDTTRAQAWATRSIEKANDKYFSRMGWMTRAHATELPSGRLLVPLYSDGYSFSLVAITDDGGQTWTTSEPIAGPGNIQPSIARRRDGTLVAYMRDNGPPPKRLHVSESKDDGITWSLVRDSDIPNPGSGSEVIVLKDGLWALVNNDLEKGRHSLPVWLSDDEGRTWKWKRHLEFDESGRFHYPSIIQAKDGTIHVSYSLFNKDGKTIKHAAFNTDWIRQGDPPSLKP